MPRGTQEFPSTPEAPPRSGRRAHRLAPNPASGSAPQTPAPEDPAAADAEPSHERLLAAVRAEVIEEGIDKISATSVARRAGLARITLYRRGGDLKRLVLSALSREMEDVVARARLDLPDASGRDRLVELALRLVRTVGRSEFVTAIVGGNPRMLAPYLTEHLGTSQRILIVAAAQELHRGMADGSIRRADPAVVATVLLQALTPFAIAAPVPDRELGSDVVDRELRRLVDGYLRPCETPL